MSNNGNLQKAKNDKFDEFYTLEKDIAAELKHYNLEGRTVYCNCDNPESSKFWQYLKDNFQNLGLTKLMATYLSDIPMLTEYDGNSITTTPLADGSFSSEECLELLEGATVITNPPFSLFRDFLKTLINHNNEFLILGSFNNITYKDIFPYIQEKRLWLGVNNGSMSFIVPEYFEKANVYEKDGVKYAKFGNICWYTNIGDPQHKELKLTATYDPAKYPKYDDYDAIEVSKLKDIPKDYYEPMGVPITILQYLNPAQFEILGNLGSYGVDGYSLAPAIYVNGKKIFKRILIRRKSNVQT